MCVVQQAVGFRTRTSVKRLTLTFNQNISKENFCLAKVSTEFLSCAVYPVIRRSPDWEKINKYSTFKIFSKEQNFFVVFVFWLLNLPDCCKWINNYSTDIYWFVHLNIGTFSECFVFIHFYWNEMLRKSLFLSFLWAPLIKHLEMNTGWTDHTATQMSFSFYIHFILLTLFFISYCFDHPSSQVSKPTLT